MFRSALLEVEAKASLVTFTCPVSEGPKTSDLESGLPVHCDVLIAHSPLKHGSVY